MLVLALDTATPAVTAGVVELTADGIEQRSVVVTHDPRKHAELLMPGVVAACADAGLALRDLDAVVTGTGPGPFTGLRVGMVTAAALGDALGVPVHGACSLDAIAADALASGGWPVEGSLLVLTDARRREVYWAVYTATRTQPHPDSRGWGWRVVGPHVDAPAVVVGRVGELGIVAAAGAPGLADPGVPLRAPATPSPAGLVAVVAADLRAGIVPRPVEPLYLRRPDAAEPGPRKRVAV